MANETVQQSLGEIPPREEFLKKIPGNPSKNDYKKYFEPVYKHLASLGEGKVTTKDDVLNSISADVKKARKWQKARKVLAVNPQFADKIVDGFPPGRVLVAISSRRIGTEPSAIQQSDINDIQKKCVEYVTEFRNQHADYFLKSYQQRAEKTHDVDTTNGKISVENYKQIQSNLRKLVAQEYRTEIISLDQSIVSSAGSANEALAAKALEAAGLTEGKDFEDVSRKGWDITISCDRSPVNSTLGGKGELYVEVKSTGLRERSVKGLADTDEPTVLFGFFDQPKELIGKIDGLMNRSFVAYVPPKTLEQAEKLGGQTNDGEDILEAQSTVDGEKYTYLRPNTRFGTDMAHFINNGDIPRSFQ